MTDTNKLKELAERATPGRNFDRLPSAGGGLKYTCTGDDESLVLRVDHKNGEFGFIGPKGEEDEAFFLACTPKAVLELIAEVERLRSALSTPETITAEPAGDYDTLRKQFMSLRTLANSNAKMAHHWRQQSGIEMRETLLVNAENVNAERTINEQLTYSLLDAEDKADRLKAENEALRQIVSECATACGAGCSPECTLDFMSMLPDEIASVVGKRARNAAIGGVVWQFIDRMTDVCEEDPAERILEQFVAAVRPAIDAALEGGGR